VTDVASQDELALPPAQVEELLQFLAKALRAHQLYLPNNPVYQKSLDSLQGAFRKLWEATDDLVLDITESELKWEGNVVYSQASRNESFAWVFFKDGVRQISFLKGVEDGEILGVLDVIQRARALQAEDNDDLLTLLWEKDFQRVQYVFQDMAADNLASLPTADDVRAANTAPTVVRNGVAAEVGQPPTAGVVFAKSDDEETDDDQPQRSRAGIVKTEDFDTTLYFLDDKEIEFLRGAVSEEYSQDLRRNVLAMLFDVMELQPFATVRTELISILESFLPYLLGASDFPSVAYVLRESRAIVQRARELTPEHRETLEKIPARLSEEQTLSQLLQSLDEAAVHASAEELGELFGELRPEALPTLFNWLPRLTNARVKDVVEAAVQRLAATNVSTVIAALQSKEPQSVIAAIRVAGRLKLAPAVAGLGQTLQHPDVAVRVSAVQALAEIASPSAIQSLEKGLDDSDREVRIQSVRVVAQHKSRSALPRITNVVQGKTMRHADLTEKMAFFEAYGSLVGDGGVDALDGMLNSGGFLKRKEDPEVRACAAMALGRIGSEAARVSLQKALQDKEPLVRNAVTRALRGDRSSTMIRAGEVPS